MKKLMSGLMAGSLLLTLAVCGEKPAASADLMAEVHAADQATAPLTSEEQITLTDLALRLVAETEGENVLLSPLSIAMALSMTANGAQGDTLTQMENALGLPLDQLNRALHSYAVGLPQSDEARLLPANSVWYADDRGLTVEPDFLQANADWYGAQIYSLPFDQAACDVINRWVGDHTDGMIPHILDELPEAAVMCLVNALGFEADWREPYEEYQVSEAEFFAPAGTVRVDFLHSEEHTYLEHELCCGVAKPYAKGYEFVALLPRDQTITPAELLAQLDGDALHELLAGPSRESVTTAIPRLEVSYDLGLIPALRAMGVTDAFEPATADFSAMGHSERGNLFIGDVVHSTFLSLGEKGTRAGAATVVVAEDQCAVMGPEHREVILNRPFVYLLADQANHIPFFIGTMDCPAD